MLHAASRWLFLLIEWWCTVTPTPPQKKCFKSSKFYRKAAYLPSVNATHNEGIMARHVGAKYWLHHLVGTSPDSPQNWLISTFVSSKHAQYHIPTETLLYRRKKKIFQFLSPVQYILSAAEGPIQQSIIPCWGISKEVKEPEIQCMHDQLTATIMKNQSNI